MRIDRLGRVGACAGFLSSALGVARCGRSAGCVLCVLWAMSAAVLGRAPCGDKHIIIKTAVSREGASSLPADRRIQNRTKGRVLD